VSTFLLYGCPAGRFDEDRFCHGYEETEGAPMKKNSRRKSHCIICGKRLSEKTASSVIRWGPGYVDDTGLYCDSCYTAKKKDSNNKGGAES
jgi:hypothetical protein